MRVKAINRSETEFARERRQDLQKVHKNLDPNLHPHEKAVEYTRALNAAKLDRHELAPAGWHSLTCNCCCLLPCTLLRAVGVLLCVDKETAVFVQGVRQALRGGVYARRRRDMPGAQPAPPQRPGAASSPWLSCQA